MKRLCGLALVLLVVLSSATGCSNNAEAQGVFDREESADLIIVGSGAAGLSAALEAVEAGAQKVIILEQNGFTGGALNTTSGTLSGAETIIQELDGLTGDSLESYKQDILTEGEKLGGEPNEELVDLYVKEAQSTINWLWEKGLSEYDFRTDQEGRKSVFAPEHTLYSYPRSYKAAPKDTVRYKSATHELLDQMIQNDDRIEVKLYTRATELVPNKKGQVLSVLGEEIGGEETITKYNSKYGIIMATGGYAANPTLMEHFNEHAGGVITGGLPYADGSALQMMQKVGGALDEKSMGWIPTFPMGLESLTVPGTGVISTTKTQFAGGILVNKNGERFVNEVEQDNVIREVALEKQPDGLQFEIYTDKIVEDILNSNQGGMMKNIFLTERGKPYVVEANSLEELAEKLELPTETFLQTVATYNQHVESKQVDALGREYVLGDNPFNLAINKIEGTKYYAVPIKPIALLTMGGITTNNKMQVLDEKGEVIPGLYAAGETVGGVWGRYVSSGCGVTGPLAFGRIAARNIINEPMSGSYKVKPATNLLEDALFEKEESNKEQAYDMSNLKDGTYHAEVDGQEGKMKVEVVIANGILNQVTIASHHETMAIAEEALASIPAAMVEQNQVMVDSVSGATLTSKRIMQAVILCLDEAKK
ncbi:MAG: FAD-dependent oxidoreductase [Erysipelotrichaceae bacterium]